MNLRSKTTFLLGLIVITNNRVSSSLISDALSSFESSSKSPPSLKSKLSPAIFLNTYHYTRLDILYSVIHRQSFSLYCFRYYHHLVGLGIFRDIQFHLHPSYSLLLNPIITSQKLYLHFQ